MRQSLKTTQEQRNKLIEQKNLTKEIEMVVSNLQSFSDGIDENFDKLDLHAKQDMIRCVVKRIEIGNEEINVVYKVNKLPEHKDNVSAQHCCNGTYGSAEGGD